MPHCYKRGDWYEVKIITGESFVARARDKDYYKKLGILKEEKKMLFDEHYRWYQTNNTKCDGYFYIKYSSYFYNKSMIKGMAHGKSAHHPELY